MVAAPPSTRRAAIRISSPEEFSKFLASEVTRWAKVVKENHILVGQ